MDEDITVGDLRLSPSRLTVSCRGEVTVQPLVMDVLRALALSDTVVMRATLEAQIWKDDHVSYHSLPRAVSQARRALAEVHSSVRIEAVPKRGYRLDAAAVEAASHARVDPPRAGWPATLPAASWIALILMIGLVMHAADLHGSPWHYLALAAVAAAFAMPPRFMLLSRSPARGARAAGTSPRP